MDDRRGVVEIGTDCAASSAEYERALSLYSIDCQSYSVPCEVSPSLPFRHAASAQVRIHVSEDGDALVWAVADPRLRDLPKLEDPNQALVMSIIKLLLMTLAAGVVWIRSAKATSSNARLFTFCLSSVHCAAENKDTAAVKPMAIFEDAALGAVAIGLRLAVSIWRIETLRHDGQTRVGVAQLVAAGLSATSWAMRNFLLEHRCESPLTKLGGARRLSTPRPPSSSPFPRPPMLVSSIGRFEPTARLLTALLLVMVTLQRCAFAAACCAALWGVAGHDLVMNAPRTRFSRPFNYFLLVAAIFWILQAASISILLADCFASPLSFSVTRAVAGESRSIALAVFFGLTAASMPQLVRTAEKIGNGNRRKFRHRRRNRKFLIHASPLSSVLTSVRPAGRAPRPPLIDHKSCTSPICLEGVLGASSTSGKCKDGKYAWCKRCATEDAPPVPRHPRKAMHRGPCGGRAAARAPRHGLPPRSSAASGVGHVAARAARATASDARQTQAHDSRAARRRLLCKGYGGMPVLFEDAVRADTFWATDGAIPLSENAKSGARVSRRVLSWDAIFQDSRTSVLMEAAKGRRTPTSSTKHLQAKTHMLYECQLPGRGRARPGACLVEDACFCCPALLLKAVWGDAAAPRAPLSSARRKRGSRGGDTVAKRLWPWLQKPQNGCSRPKHRRGLRPDRCRCR